MINSAKFEVCSKAKKDLLALSEIDFQSYFQKLMKEMNYIYRIKGGVYC